MLATRLISAAILIPLVALAVYLGGYALLAAVALAAVLACWEYLALVQQRPGVAPWRPLALLATLLLVAEAQWPHLTALRALLVALPLVLLVREVFRANRPASLESWALGVAGPLYIGGALGHFLRLRALDHGLEWLALALLSTWICDTGAYFVGRAWGRRRFFPAISPKKTWEGALSGLLSGMAAVMALGWWWLDLPPWQGAILGVLLALAATFGDLAESVIKRQVGVKDSGRLIPGHGGMLDRVDSLLFVVPVVYYAARALVALTGVGLG